MTYVTSSALQRHARRPSLLKEVYIPLTKAMADLACEAKGRCNEFAGPVEPLIHDDGYMNGVLDSFAMGGTRQQLVSRVVLVSVLGQFCAVVFATHSRTFNSPCRHTVHTHKDDGDDGDECRDNHRSTSTSRIDLDLSTFTLSRRPQHARTTTVTSAVTTTASPPSPRVDHHSTHAMTTTTSAVITTTPPPPFHVDHYHSMHTMTTMNRYI